MCTCHLCNRYKYYSDVKCCPVCNGRGFVSFGFYSPYYAGSSTQVEETCRSCNGLGVIFLT